MIAVDTNILVRIIVNDDPGQARRATARMRTDRAWISRTVLLETEWVLRHAYNLDVSTIDKAFTTLLGISSIEVEDRAAVLGAMVWHRKGMDFADALHLSVSGGATAFVSFDKALERTGRRVGAKPAVVAP